MQDGEVQVPHHQVLGVYSYVGGQRQAREEGHRQPSLHGQGVIPGLGCWAAATTEPVQAMRYIRLEPGQQKSSPSMTCCSIS